MRGGGRSSWKLWNTEGGACTHFALLLVKVAKRANQQLGYSSHHRLPYHQTVTVTQLTSLSVTVRSKAFSNWIDRINTCWNVLKLLNEKDEFAGKWCRYVSANVATSCVRCNSTSIFLKSLWKISENTEMCKMSKSRGRLGIERTQKIL